MPGLKSTTASRSSTAFGSGYKTSHIPIDVFVQCAIDAAVKLAASPSPLTAGELGAQGLVVNIIVLWNTLSMTAAMERLRQHGYPVLDEDLARLSEHIDMSGRYSFAVPEEVARGELRPLRNPDDDL